jgi:drug/metabolite transporter (DMT)-like permease
MTTASETMPPGAGPDEADLRQRGFPPVARLGTLTLALTVAGGVVMAANYGKAPSLSAPIALAVAAGVVLVVNVILLARVKDFAWTPFFRVLGWTLLAYFVIAGILEFVFIFDHTPAHQLALFSALLFLFATDVPLILAFSVARWQLPDAA